MANCANCGREFQPIAESQSFCDDCRAQHTAASQPRKGIPLSLYLKSPTVWLIVVNTLIFVVTCLLSRTVFDIRIDTLVYLGADFIPYTLGGQPWRILTATFLHGGLWHLLVNMWALLNLGILAEILFGRRSYTAMYFLCGLAGSIASVWWHCLRGDLSVVGAGASGAIFGIAGALVPALALQKNARLRKALAGNLISICVFILYTVATGLRNAVVDNSAHLGGLAAGLVLGLALPSSPGPNDERHFTRRVVVLVAGTVAVAASFLSLQKSQMSILELSLGKSAFLRKDYTGAIAHLNKSLDRNPPFFDSEFLLGVIYREQENYVEAKRHLLAASKLAPDSPNAYGELCIAYLRSDQVPDAVAACKRAVELDQNNPDRQLNLGLVQRANGDVDGALVSFTKAQQLRPNAFDEEAMLGETLVDAGRTNDAIVHLRAANKAKPDDQHVRMLLVRLLINRGDREEARKIKGR